MSHLQPENILLANNSDVTLAKVSDFGLSKLVDAQTMMKTFCGTPMYVAPEILSTIGRGSYTNQVCICNKYLEEKRCFIFFNLTRLMYGVWE